MKSGSLILFLAAPRRFRRRLPVEKHTLLQAFCVAYSGFTLAHIVWSLTKRASTSWSARMDPKEPIVCIWQSVHACPLRVSQVFPLHRSLSPCNFLSQSLVRVLKISFLFPEQLTITLHFPRYLNSIEVPLHRWILCAVVTPARPRPRLLQKYLLRVVLWSTILHSAWCRSNITPESKNSLEVRRSTDVEMLICGVCALNVT